MTSRSQGADKSPDFERIREMDAAFDKFTFPQDDHSSFSSTCIYWKKRDVNAGLELNIDGLRISDKGDGSRDNNADKADEKETQARP